MDKWTSKNHHIYNLFLDICSNEQKKNIAHVRHSVIYFCDARRSDRETNGTRLICDEFLAAAAAVVVVSICCIVWRSRNWYYASRANRYG